MEALFLVLIGAALFAQGWDVLGFYVQSKTVGLLAGAAAAILVTGVLFGPFAPILLEANSLPATAFLGFVLLWAMYLVAIAGGALWGWEGRVVGFYALFLWAVSIVYLVGLPVAFDTEEVSNQAAIVLVPSSLILGIVAALMFFYQAIPFRELKAVTGWLMIGGSVLLAFLGFSIFLGILTG